MGEISREGHLDIPNDPDFERRNHLVQRVGWGLMAVLVGVALLGGLGRGILASASATSDRGGIRLDYDRITRHASRSRFILTLSGPAVADGRALVTISRGFLDEMDVPRVMPEPDGTRAGVDALAYDFLVPPGRPARIVFAIEPRGYGMHEGRVHIPATGEAVSFRVFVLP